MGRRGFTQPRETSLYNVRKEGGAGIKKYSKFADKEGGGFKKYKILWTSYLEAYRLGGVRVLRIVLASAP